MVEKQKRRLFGLLRAKRAEPVEPASAADSGAMWAAHARALSRAREAGDAAARIGATVAKQRGALDAVGERARAVAARSHDLAASLARVVETLEKLSLLALNAGLEGARLGEQAGRALSLVGEEVRKASARGTEGARELGQALGEVSGELAQVAGSLDRAREASVEIGQEATRASGAAADAERALADLDARLRRATGSDPETERAVGAVVEHGRAFVAALASLGERVPRGTRLTLLRPVIEALGAFVGEDEGGEG